MRVCHANLRRWKNSPWRQEVTARKQASLRPGSDPAVCGNKEKPLKDTRPIAYAICLVSFWLFRRLLADRPPWGEFAPRSSALGAQNRPYTVKHYGAST